VRLPVAWIRRRVCTVMPLLAYQCGVHSLHSHSASHDHWHCGMARAAAVAVPVVAADGVPGPGEPEHCQWKHWKCQWCTQADTGKSSATGSTSGYFKFKFKTGDQTSKKLHTSLLLSPVLQPKPKKYDLSQRFTSGGVKHDLRGCHSRRLWREWEAPLVRP